MRDFSLNSAKTVEMKDVKFGDVKAHKDVFFHDVTTKDGSQASYIIVGVSLVEMAEMLKIRGITADEKKTFVAIVNAIPTTETKKTAAKETVTDDLEYKAFLAWKKAQGKKVGTK